jgi:2-polyprenyl-6-methoxyphenol hydroxylase-like FAD-dependent oxidoreductase
MAHSSFQVAIVGAGLGGLCLAQGLRKAGLDVAVYERDATASARAQGYRISLDARADDALRACLPASLFQLFEMTRGQPSTGLTLFSFEGDTLRERHTMRFAQEPRPGLPAAGHAVDRLVLRETLLAGLDDTVQFGKEFTEYTLQPSAVDAQFADGTSVTCDVLVAADGVSSRVRQQFLPDTRLVDTGMRWLGGRTVLDDRLRELLPGAVTDRAISVMDCGQAFFLAAVLFQQRPNDVAGTLSPGLRYTDNDDFLMWAYVGHLGSFLFSDDQLFGTAEAELYRLAVESVNGCHPMLKNLIEAGNPERCFSLAIRSVPQVEPWPSSRITFIGDAIHASPINGTGANAALEDAAVLCTYLTRGVGGDLQRALDEYEMDLLSRISAMRARLALHQAAIPNRTPM